MPGLLISRVLPLLALAVMIALGWSIFREARKTIWCFYSDDVSIRADGAGADVRPVLWSDPHPAYAAFDTASGRHEASFSPDETWMALTRGAEDGTNADLYVSRWDGRTWSEPVEFAEINSASNEIGAAWGPEGNYLYFVSDRPGGYGGYDIWVASWTGGKWGAATNLGPSVNSAGDELGPVATHDGKHLYFSSDRSGSRQQDIFRATRIITNADPSQDSAPSSIPDPVLPVPRFEAAERIEVLCSSRDDMSPAPSARGDFIYFASNRRGGMGGFDIYCSRIVGGEVMQPENLRLGLNSKADDMCPAVRMEGFDMLFSSNRGEDDGNSYRLYSSTVREVVGALDLSRWHQLTAALNRVKWWFLVLATAFALLLYLLKHFRDLTSLKHKCIMASIVLHVVLLLAMAFWMISAEFMESMAPRSMEVALDVDSLAQEKLALDMRDDVAELPPTDVSVPIEQVLEALPEPEFMPTREIEAPPVVMKTADNSFVTKVTPSKLNDKPVDAAQSQEGAKLPALELPQIEMPAMEVVMEEPAPVERREEVADRTVEFDPAEVQQVVTVEFKTDAKPRREPVGKPEAMIGEMVTNLVADVAKRREAGDTIVEASAGAETAGAVTHLAGDGKVRDVLNDVRGSGHTIQVAALGKLATPAIGGARDAGDGKVSVAPGSVQGDVAVGFTKLGKLGADGPATTIEAGDIAGGVGGDAGGEGAKVRDTGGIIAVASAGPESPGSLPRLKGIGDTAMLMVKSPGPGMRLRINAPGKLDIPKGWGQGISPHILKYPGRLSPEVIGSLGGSAETQGSIGHALDWFTKNQEEDGHWDIARHGGEAGHDVAATALTLLCYYGWGAKHTEDGQYRETVGKALKWLLSQMKEGGDFCSGRGGNQGMYDHGMATIALCEAYGLTKDEKLLEPAKQAVDFILKAQDEGTGGWRYQPRSGSDTSVFGWQFMALNSAKLAGIEVPDSAFVGARRWLDKVGGGQQGGIYGYQQPEADRPAMIATGMFCRQLDMTPPTAPRMIESAVYMRGHPLDPARMDYYYLYYGTLALYQHQGEIWEQWNEKMKETLTSAQVKTGADAGSWNISSEWHGNRMGRAVGTAFATLSLEVYYRILPIYGFRGGEKE